jgi:endonuclease/exonuclease/phosphatase family metal-dependent hydrolase
VLRVASYNVGGGLTKSAFPDRPSRLLAVADAIREAAPDLVAFQEFPTRDAHHLVEAMREAGYRPEPGSAKLAARERIFHRPGLRPLRAGRERIGKGDPTRRPRHLHWSEWSLPDGGRLHVCNVHLVDSRTRLTAAAKMVSRLKAGATLLLGDFNLLPTSRIHHGLRTVGWQDAALSCPGADAGPTIHRYGSAGPRRVDWILVPPGWAPRGYFVRRVPDLAWEPSDHHLVWADLAQHSVGGADTTTPLA